MTERAEDPENLQSAGWEGSAPSDNVIPFRPAKHGKQAAPISFDRRELDQILRVYGFKVAEGEWRDYAIDMLKDRAVFSVFRRTSETPLHTIEKNPRNARRQGAYSVTGAKGQVLKRGHDLAQVLKVLEKKPRLVRL